MTPERQLVIARFTDPHRPGRHVWRAAVRSRINSEAVAFGYCEDCLGHDGPKEAIEHLVSFIVEQRTLFDSATQEGPCLVCAEPTFGVARILVTGESAVSLCDRHRRKVDLETALLQRFWYEYIPGGGSAGE